MEHARLHIEKMKDLKPVLNDKSAFLSLQFKTNNRELAEFQYISSSKAKGIDCKNCYGNSLTCPGWETKSRRLWERLERRRILRREAQWPYEPSVDHLLLLLQPTLKNGIQEETINATIYSFYSAILKYVLPELKGLENSTRNLCCRKKDWAPWLRLYGIFTYVWGYLYSGTLF